MKNFLLKLAISFDYFVNSFAPASKPGMTISSHAGMARHDGRLWGKFTAWILDHIQTDHCLNAMKNDTTRAQAVVDELKPYIS